MQKKLTKVKFVQVKMVWQII